MFRDCRSLLSLLAIALTLAISAQAQSSLPAGIREAALAEVAGRWALIATIRNAEDVTQSGVTQGGAVSIYDFKADGTFSITRGDSVAETGTWAADSSVVPKTFDHIPNVGGRPGRLVPGIYETGGGALKICFLPPSESNTRPTKCEAKPENGSRIYIMKRDAK